MILLALLLQSAAATPVAQPAVPPAPQRWSILVPVANEACRPAAKGDDILVCADPLPTQRLPLPDEIVPDGPRPSNPYRTGSGALAAEGAPCATAMGGCVVGFGPPIIPIVEGLVGLAKDAFARHPDKSKRIAIPLDDPVPPTVSKKDGATQPSGD
ncbi:hypothetical protein G4G27_13445 [Sphingomonas sp. So64.6b]|uniref:hypothetical protein n=1 Tax=Sphingomonas sp. So64.6b TaxID=2997354 RepID=UPI001602BC3E|nr:hypothetical protein [Sphingomonas sp. So64.6b]QNA84889.1 hypothetical protein G4G27_13445 [Sphingomonas sp. So64.6b]